MAEQSDFQFNFSEPMAEGGAPAVVNPRDLLDFNGLENPFANASFEAFSAPSDLPAAGVSVAQQLGEAMAASNADQCSAGGSSSASSMMMMEESGGLGMPRGSSASISRKRDCAGVQFEEPQQQQVNFRDTGALTTAILSGRGTGPYSSYFREGASSSESAFSAAQSAFTQSAPVTPGYCFSPASAVAAMTLEQTSKLVGDLPTRKMRRAKATKIPIPIDETMSPQDAKRIKNKYSAQKSRDRKRDFMTKVQMQMSLLVDQKNQLEQAIVQLISENDQLKGELDAERRNRMSTY